MISRGVLYVATGKKYLDEAVTSAQSVKTFMPHLHTTIFTDDPDFHSACFDEIRHIKNPQYSYIDKIEPLKASPYHRTLYLDSDTYISCNFEELFMLLDRFDIAVAHDTWRIGYPVATCPDSFLELNTGVILYKNDRAVIDLFDDWLSYYKKQMSADPTVPHDQSAFRKVLYDSDLSLYILPSEYNYTVWFPGFIGAQGKVKIVHGRNGRLTQTAKWINESLAARVFIPDRKFFHRSSFNILSPGDQKIVEIFGKIIEARSRIFRFFRSGFR